MSVIRTVLPNDVSKMIGCFTAAFVTDPVARYLYPDASDYFSSFGPCAEHYIGDALASGTVFSIDEFRGVAAFLGPTGKIDEDTLVAIIQSSMAAELAEEFLTVIETSNVDHPDEPHWYLPIIGVDPLYQGNGYGGQLMQHALMKIDQDHLPIYLESSNPQNVSLYQRFGFKVCHCFELGGKPIFTTMLRPAQ